MQRIANTRELNQELQSLLAYVGSSSKPSRQVVATRLRQLGQRVAGQAWKVTKVTRDGGTERYEVQLDDRQVSGVRMLGPALRNQGVISPDDFGIRAIKRLPDGTLELSPKARASADWDSMVLTPAGGPSQGGSAGLPGAKRELVLRQLAPYGYSLSENDEIQRGDKNLQVRVMAKGSRLYVQQLNGTTLWSGSDVGYFVQDFWYATKIAMGMRTPRPRNNDLDLQRGQLAVACLRARVQPRINSRLELFLDPWNPRTGKTTRAWEAHCRLANVSRGRWEARSLTDDSVLAKGGSRMSCTAAVIGSLR